MTTSTASVSKPDPHRGIGRVSERRVGLAVFDTAKPLPSFSIFRTTELLQRELRSLGQVAEMHSDALYRIRGVPLTAHALMRVRRKLDANADLAKQLKAMFDSEGVVDAPQLAYSSEVTFPSEDLFPGAYVDGFLTAWNAVVGNWRSHQGKPPKAADRVHAETHVLDGRDVFLTDDRPLLVMCHRLHDEHGVNLVAMGLVEYLEGRRR